MEQDKKQKKNARKSFAVATNAIKMVYPSSRPPYDPQLEQMVYSQSTVVDTIMKDSSDDLGRFITYLRQRVELEEGYQTSLDRILGSLQQGKPSSSSSSSSASGANGAPSSPPRDPKQTTTLYHGFMAHVDTSVHQRPLRIQYIQAIKGQLQALAELKVRLCATWNFINIKPFNWDSKKKLFLT
ncbi:hypothetical protein BDB00DRAFT_355041 [Zychaea mexicana]|uniref:uncharacterized protein n=1 Tax=Zychaea mexicana TaxID=64656 RepID=UPI0022FF0764|nr:uncharacterized protein BDB00DRAFT_355041 [Zychaea mexicana]KAI9493800.1 hypothetical protein BDB00DRAFT_355041 [Zychaea mexicana]